ncbi:MAG: zinc ribbon domain-containing protein [Deltaproteobacteria bacterium]|nr:zinc ribbon domain-containing protein [Deltaproteobacteria bacterium]
MPLYEYQCETCSHIIEELQKFSDPPLKTCPHCGGRLTKLMSLNTFHLKGSGWYATDYTNKKGPGKSPESHDTKPAKKTDSSSKKETKKEAKKET